MMPGEQFIPFNSDDGSLFLDGICVDCDRDKELNGTKVEEECGEGDHCPIVARSFSGKAVEWRKINGIVMCAAFWPKGVQEPCPNTRDLFTGEATK